MGGIAIFRVELQRRSTALAELSQASLGDTTALQEAVEAISATRSIAPAPAPSEETMRLLETDASEFDDELLDGAALRAIDAGECSALVTAPLHKQSIAAAGARFPGHTELLASRGVGVSAWRFLTPAAASAKPSRRRVAAATASGAVRTVGTGSLRPRTRRSPRCGCGSIRRSAARRPCRRRWSRSWRRRRSSPPPCR